MKSDVSFSTFPGIRTIRQWSCTILILSGLLLQFSNSNLPSYSPCNFIEGIEHLRNLECGQIEVPENYDEPEGRKFLISYVVIKSSNSQEDKYPMIHLTGGPGGSSLVSGRIKNWYNSPIAQERDIILFDQRGIGHSSCLSNLNKELHDIIADDLNPEEERIATQSLVKKYKANAIDKKIDLSAYNSFSNARDVGKLMEYLPYEKYNVYGTSYGTRLGRIVQDMFPGKINSVIHNSPAPISGDMLIDRLKSYSLALDRIFQYCENNATCSQTYPKLQEDYLKAIGQIKKKPLKIQLENGEFTLNAQDAIYFLRRHLYRSNAKEQIPHLISSLLKNDLAPFKQTIQNEFNPGYNYSMWMAVEKYEQYSDQNTGPVIQSTYNELPLLPETLGLFDAIYQSLAFIHDESLPPGDRNFKISHVPTIIMVNHYDPVTPPKNGHLFLKDLPNGQLFILDEGGHGGGSQDCRLQVMSEFMNSPDQPLDTSCLKIYKDH